MADLFWRRRLKKQERVILLSLPNLPDDIDDNVFIALAAQAAEQDKKSGAYDEFMFSEDGYASMPFEDSVDEFLELQIQRTPERQGRAELPHKLRLEHFKKIAEEKARRVAIAEGELQTLEPLIASEIAILDGQQVGNESADWSGVRPEVTSKSRHVSRRLIGWLVFLLVAGVDFGVVLFSLMEITDTFKEALLFTFPAVGVQILFPHLIGRAISSLQRKKGNTAKDLTIAIGVGVSWIFYIIGMTILRLNLLETYYKNEYKKQMPDNLYYASFIITVFILVGLGLWVMIRSMSDNPHEDKFSRLKFVEFSKTNKLARARKKLAWAESLCTKEERILELIAEQWEKRRENYQILGEAAKSTYRRALVNQEGQPQFTTTYLPKETQTRRSKREKNA